MTIAFRSAGGLLWLLSLQSLLAEDRPPFDQLLQLNSKALFGTKAELKGEDKVELNYKKGQLARAVEGQGLVNPDDLKGVNHQILDGVTEPVAVGRGDGDWQSRFELSGNVEVSFKLKIPAVQRGGQLTLWINKTPKASLQTSFFQSAALVAGGKVKKRVAAPKEYQASPEKWFEKNKPVDVALAYQAGKFSVKLKGAEILSLDEAAEAPGGRIGISFHKLTFVISELKISGKIDRAWCEAQFQELEAKGSLALKEKPPDPAPAAPPLRSSKKEADAREARKKEVEAEL